MQYLRAIIKNETGGILYRKDFKVQNVFDIFVRSFVTRLIITGMLQEGDFYRAHVIPRYGEYQRISAQALPPSPIIKEGERSDWLTLNFEDDINLHRPFDYFTLDLTIPKLGRRMRSNFQLIEIDYFWRRIEQALEQTGRLRYKETLRHELYACDDAAADFEHEEMPALSGPTKPLVEIVSVESTQPAFAQKSLADFHVRSIKKLQRGQLINVKPGRKASSSESGQENADRVQVLITQSVLASLQQIACSQVQLEQGGTLVGDVYVDANSPARSSIVVITGHIVAEQTFASEVELRYTFESWQNQTALLKEHFPTKRIVGWYHTHLDLVRKTFYTDESYQDVYTSPLFFSKDDHFTHRQFFREKWYVAMVLDPQGNLIFFQWDDDAIVDTNRFYVIDDGDAGNTEESTRQED